MLQLLQHLWPDFSALAQNTTAGLSAIFWLIMMAIVTIASVFLFKHWSNFNARMAALKELLGNQTKENLAVNRREVLQQALGQDNKEVGFLWREFDESLVAPSDQGRLYNTLDADHFFNPRTLAHGLTASRLLAATPSFLVALGVFGTFVGLTVGLRNLNVQSDDINVLKSGIDQLIGGAAVAFMTSVWGVGLSLLFNFVEKLLERTALGQIRQIQQTIDYLYPRLPAEQSLVHIAEYTNESKEALQELHERIGDRLQETIQGMGADMQQAVTDALNSVMAPAIQTLVNSAQQQSSDVIGHLMGQFVEGMNSVGREQGDQLQRAADEVNAAVTTMNERFNQLAETLNEQHTRQQSFTERQSAQLEEQLVKLSHAAEQREQEQQKRFLNQMDSVKGHHDALLEGIAASVQTNQEQSRALADQHHQLMDRLLKATEAASASSKHMENSANQLGLLSTNVREASQILGERLGSVTDRIQQASTQNAELASQLTEHGRVLAGLQNAMLGAAQRLEEASKQACEGFDRMSDHQNDFLSAIGDEFKGLGSELRAQVETIEKQAEEWLQAYAKETNAQVDERMNEWNRQTQQFSNQMVRVVERIGTLVDELETT